MEMLQELLRQQGPALAVMLVEKLGFDSAQAQRFVPIAAEKLIAALSGGDLDLTSLLGGADLDALIGKIDVPELASEAGVAPAKARSGLEEIGPALLSGLGGQAGGAGALLGALGGDAGGGLLGAASTLGGLFGKK